MQPYVELQEFIGMTNVILQEILTNMPYLISIESLFTCYLSYEASIS